MPPKKNKNTIEKELKKKHKEAAENLVKMLEQKKSNVEGEVSSVNFSEKEKATYERAGSTRAAKRVENPTKRAKDIVASSSKKATASEKDKSGSKRTAEKKDEPGSKRSTKKDAPDSKRSREKDKRVSTRQLDELESVSSSKTSSNEKLSKDGANIPKKRFCWQEKIPKAAKEFRYEIDCERVKDSVDVKDLRQFITMQLKVDGEKNNLDGNMTVGVDGHRVVINSKVFIPKRSLRFVSKKFLKKSWNIQVTSQNKNSYELKYVGTS